MRENLVVDLFVLDQRHTAVVDADEDAEHVGLQFERVLLPALLQVEHRIAADATIDEVELQLGKRRPVLGRDDEHVPVPEDMVRVGAAPAIAVRDRIALEQDSGAGRESGNGLGGAQGEKRYRREGNEQRHHQ